MQKHDVQQKKHLSRNAIFTQTTRQCYAKLNAAISVECFK